MSIGIVSRWDAQQDRLLKPPRIENFCPMVHCGRSCGPNDCTCKPCTSRCPHCRERKKNSCARRTVAIANELRTELPNHQIRLFTERTLT